MLTVRDIQQDKILAFEAGKPLAHSKTLAAVWGPEYGGEVDYLRTFMYQLRWKLKTILQSPLTYYRDLVRLSIWFCISILSIGAIIVPS